MPVISFDSIGLNSLSIDTTLTSDFLPAPNVACWLFLLALLVRFLKVFSYAEAPIVTLNEKSKNKQNGEICLKEVLASCPILQERYNPPAIFGKNGHLQVKL
jgi:hypothetical protein